MTTLSAADSGDLLTVRSWSDLAAHLQGIQKRSGLSLGDIQRAAKKLAVSGSPYCELPTSTVSDALNGRRTIRNDLLRTLLEVLEVPSEERQKVRRAWQRLSTSVGQGPALAGHVAEATGRDLGVHPAIPLSDGFGRPTTGGGSSSSSSSSSEFPRYVERDFDQTLREMIKKGLQEGVFVLLLGGSSCGKTRSLFEAVRELVPGSWWLAQPTTTQEIRDLVQVPTEDTVLWLDDFHQFLGADPPLRQADFKALRKAGMIIVGTVWPVHYHSRRQLDYGDTGDIYAEDRKILEASELIPVSAQLSEGELRRARALAPTDQRVATALSMVDTGFTQVLAAAPDLVHLWEVPPTPYCQAAISSAADARRLGVRVSLSTDTLATAMAGYLTRSQRASPARTWLERALAHAASPRHGEVTALVPDGDDGSAETFGDHQAAVSYRAADYLTEYIGRARRTICPPESLWQALARDLRGAEDLRRLAGAALARMRYTYAERALSRLHDEHDDSAASAELIALLRRQDRLDEALEVADVSLAAKPADQQRRDRWDALIRLQVHVDKLRDPSKDDPHSAAQLAELLADGGRAYELRSLAERGNARAAENLAELLAERGAVVELRELAQRGEWMAAELLAGLLASLGRVSELEARANASDAAARRHLVRVRDKPREPPSADQLNQLRAVADSGREAEANELTQLLFDAGDRFGLLAEVNAGTHRAAERYLALLAADSTVDRITVRTIRAYGLDADGRPAATTTTTTP